MVLDIKIINPIDVPNWNDQIAELPGATIFHTSNWARVLSESYGYRPVYFCVYNNSALSACIPMMEINSPITGKRGVSLPFSDHVEPLLKDKDAFNEIIESIISFGRENGWRVLDLHGGDGFVDDNKSYTSFIYPSIDLNCSPEQLLKRYRNSTRRHIKKSKALGVKVGISTSRSHLIEFYRLNCMTRKKHGLPPQPIFFFENIHKHIISGDKGIVCLGYYGDKVIAGGVYFINKRTSFFKYGASDKRYLHLRPNNAVMAEAIAWSIKHNIKKMNLGRTEQKVFGQMQYKMGWGTETSTINYFKFDVPSGKLINNKPSVQSSYPLFKKLPIPLLRVVGNFVYRHIG